MNQAQSNFGEKTFKTDAVILASLFLVALGVRFIRLFSLDVWFDEVAVLLQAKMTYSQIWEFCKLENFPPLYSWLIKYESNFVHDPQHLRWLSVVIGALVPPVSYLLGKEVQGRKLGLLLGLATILSLPLLYFSQVVRMYSLFALGFTLSYVGFLRGLRTHEWKYWFLMAFANVLSFYAFLFTIFFILSEFVLLYLKFRRDWKQYFRPLAAHLPAFILMSFWFLTLLNRYQIVQSYVYSKMLLNDPLNLLIYFGTGVLYKGRYFITILFNLPFMLGFFLSIKKWTKGSPQYYLGMIFVISLGTIMFLSIVKQSIFFDRYLLFLLPIYLVLALFGWLQMDQVRWRRAGVALIFMSLLVSYAYYNVFFMDVNDEYRYHGLFHTARNDDGRSLSRTASLVQQRIGKDEVIIHFSRIVVRTLSYFPSVYRHNRSLPEYIYSVEDLPIHCGRQYLHPGDRLARLTDLNPLPAGIWVVTWENPDMVIFDSPWFMWQRENHKNWYKIENLPEQLYQCGYRSKEVIRDGSISLVHFRRMENAANSAENSAVSSSDNVHTEAPK